MKLTDMHFDLPPEALRGIEGPFEDGSYAYGGFRLELIACPGKCKGWVWSAYHNEATLEQVDAVWRRAGGSTPPIPPFWPHLGRHVDGDSHSVARYIQDAIDYFNAQVAKDVAENLRAAKEPL